MGALNRLVSVLTSFVDAKWISGHILRSLLRQAKVSAAFTTKEASLGSFKQASIAQSKNI